MNVLYLLVPLALALAAAGVGAFYWAVRDGQFDDVQTPSLRVLLDDEDRRAPPDAEPRSEAHSEPLAR